jgi:hypothetical protein
MRMVMKRMSVGMIGPSRIRQAARALHLAVKKLRMERQDIAFRRWPFIHLVLQVDVCGGMGEYIQCYDATDSGSMSNFVSWLGNI